MLQLLNILLQNKHGVLTSGKSPLVNFSKTIKLKQYA